MSRATAGTLFSFFVNAEPRRFGRSDHDAFVTALTGLDAATTCHPLSSPNELRLTPSGRTLWGNYRFTASGFRQVAGKLALGAVRLLPDLAGSVKRLDDREQYADGMLAQRLWNDLVELRFPLIARNRLVRNETQGRQTIDGLIGMNQPNLENLEFYRQASGTLKELIPTLDFSAAMLVGRRMAVWMRNSEPALSVDTPGGVWPVYRGFYFGNGETSGTAARITNALFTPVGLCLMPYRKWGKKLRHAGRKFVSRFVSHLHSAAGATLDVPRLTSAFRSLFQRLLGFKSSFTEADMDRQSRKLVHILMVAGVPQSLAGAAVADALAVGFAPAANPQFLRTRVYSTRCCADLFVSLLRVARKVDLDRRECLEQAAFELLTGRLLSSDGG